MGAPTVPPKFSPAHGHQNKHSQQGPSMSSTRKLKSWLTGFISYTQHMGVPMLWRKWAALTAVSGALERRCVLRTAKGALAPNMFVLLVSPPGVGKSVIINEVFSFWQKVPDLRLAPSSTTRAGLIDFMVDARKVDVGGEVPVVYHSVLCASPEFGNLVPQYDNAWLNILNDLYDCGSLFSDVTRKYGEIRIEHPHLCIIAGTQPKYLDNLLPDAAFGMGFTSRLLMIYAPGGSYTSLFSNVQKPAQVHDYLVEDLKTVGKMKGEFYLTPEAIELWETLAKENFKPVPEHSKLQHYVSRRPAHLLKTMMCLSASERDDFRITEDHLEAAVRLLHETETAMTQIFSEMVSKGYADANEETLAHVRETFRLNGGKSVQETALIRFLVGKVPNNQIKQTIDLLTQSGQLKLHVLNGGIRAYSPGGK